MIPHHAREHINEFSDNGLISYSALVIVAGGLGNRMESDLPKQFLLLKGRPVVEITLEKFLNTGLFREVIVVLPEPDVSFHESKLRDIVHTYSPNIVFSCIAGGNTRQESVSKGLGALSEGSDLVVIHDGVRPFVSDLDIIRVMQKAKCHGAATLGVRLKESIKEVDWDKGVVLSSLNRDNFCITQTPQAFNVDLILKAHKFAEKNNFNGYDDASLVENMGALVEIVEGSYDNIKLTVKEDMEIAELIFNKEVSECE